MPVMLAQCLDGLALRPDGVYIDVTFGGGGHSKAILERVPEARLLAFDQDPDAARQAEQIPQSSFTFIPSNFRHLQRMLKFYGIRQVDGILADLGISSYQIDTAARGFSTRFDARLDMRMDQSQSIDAVHVINETPEKALQELFSKYGEVRNARTLAAAIVEARSTKSLETLDDMLAILKPLAPHRKENRYFAQVFQAIRIQVNQEMEVLEEMLQQCASVIKPGGRLVVMSYHSLEDRLVKHFVATGNAEGIAEKDMYGNLIRPFTPITRKPVMASEEELLTNNRARSARLRIAEKNNEQKKQIQS